ncbi:MAG: divalent-cation tolerance protein CutA [Hyphomicrobium sp.]
MTENNKPVGATPLSGKEGGSPILRGIVPPDCAAVLVYAIFPDRGAAGECGRQLIARRLAGCINILSGMMSIYRWQGAVEEAEEVVLLAKTAPALAEQVAAEIVAMHPYDTPAVLVLPVLSGSAAYLDWLAEGIGAAPEAPG